MNNMIEIYTKGKKKDRIEGYIDGKKYLTRKKKLWGYLEDNMAKHKSGYPVLILKDDGKITFNEDWAFKEVGYIKDGKIYDIEDNLEFTLDKEKGEIINHYNNNIIFLRGEGINLLKDDDFFGLMGTMFSLFESAAREGDDDEDDDGLGEDIGEVIGDFLDDVFDNDD